MNNQPMDDQLIQQNGEYMEGVEILGTSKSVDRIRRLFEYSTVKIKVVQDRPSLQDSFAWDDDTRGTFTETCNDGADEDEEDHTFSPTQHNHGSSDEHSSGLGMSPTLTYHNTTILIRITDTDYDTRSPSPDSVSPVATLVSPEVRNRRNMILVQSRIKNLKEKVKTNPCYQPSLNSSLATPFYHLHALTIPISLS